MWQSTPSRVRQRLELHVSASRGASRDAAQTAGPVGDSETGLTSASVLGGWGGGCDDGDSIQLDAEEPSAHSHDSRLPCAPRTAEGSVPHLAHTASPGFRPPSPILASTPPRGAGNGSLATSSPCHDGVPGLAAATSACLMHMVDSASPVPAAREEVRHACSGAGALPGQRRRPALGSVPGPMVSPAGLSSLHGEQESQVSAARAERHGSSSRSPSCRAEGRRRLEPLASTSPPRWKDLVRSYDAQLTSAEVGEGALGGRLHGGGAARSRPQTAMAARRRAAEPSSSQSRDGHDVEETAAGSAKQGWGLGQRDGAGRTSSRPRPRTADTTRRRMVESDEVLRARYTQLRRLRSSVALDIRGTARRIAARTAELRRASLRGEQSAASTAHAAAAGSAEA